MRPNRYSLWQARRGGADSRDRPNWARNMVRRFRVAASAAVLWALEGLQDADGNVEVEEAEVFPGIGVYFRPPAGARAEAVVAKIGAESGHPAIVATRDHDTLKAVQAAGGDIGEDEGAVFTSLAWVRFRADGTVEIGAPGGTAVALATLADVQAVRNALNNHDHTYLPDGSGVATKTTGNPAVPAPTGTSVLKGQ